MVKDVILKLFQARRGAGSTSRRAELSQEPSGRQATQDLARPHQVKLIKYLFVVGFVFRLERSWDIRLKMII